MLFDVRMIDSSGIGTYIRGLLPGLCKNFETTVFTNDPTRLKGFQCHLRIYNFAAPIYSVAEQFQYILTPKSSILFSPHYNVPLLPVRSKRRVVTIHDVYHLAYFDQLTYSQKIYAKLLINMAVKVSDAVITVSEFSKKEIIRYTGCSSDKITVIPNGVKQFPIYKSAIEIRFKYQLPAKYLLYVGNVKPHKNLKTLVEAYSLLEPEIKQEYKLVIAGKKDGFITGDTALLHHISKTLGLAQNVMFTGFVEDDDMDSLYRMASLLVFPSFYEGFGLPPLEAMLNKCPVITSNAASMPDVCGDAAIFCDPFKTKDLAFKISELLNNEELRQNIAVKGLENIKKFTWESSIAKHLQLFNSLL